MQLQIFGHRNFDILRKAKMFETRKETKKIYFVPPHTLGKLTTY